MDAKEVFSPPELNKARKQRSDKGKTRKKQFVVTEKLEVHPRQQFRSLKALDKIDTRLEELVGERTEAIKALRGIAQWQERLNSINQEIESLIAMQHRLQGNAPTVAPPLVPPAVVDPMSLIPPVSTGSTYSHLQPVPPGVGSIPAKVQKIRPSLNVAEDVAGEGGFS